METATIIGIGGIIATLLTMVVFGAFFLHFHDKLKTREGRDDVVADMRGRDLAAGYTNLLASALDGLRTAAGAPFSAQSIGFCFFLAVLYALASAIAGWGGGGSGGLGSVGMFSRPEWVPAPVSDGWLALGMGMLIAALGCTAFLLLRWGDRRNAELTRRGKPWLGKFVAWGAIIVVVAVAVAAAVAVAGAAAGAVAVAAAAAGAVAAAVAGAGAVAVAVAGAAAVAAAVAVAVIFGLNEANLALLIFWVALPLINTASDYLSLGFSHWFGRKIVDDPGHSITRATLYGLADLGLALAFMVIAAATIPMALALLQWATAFDLGVRTFVTDAAADPWGAGLWFGIMILTTLVWTGLHLLITLGAVLFRLYDAFPLDRRVANVIEAGKDRLWVKLYLSGKWLVATALWCALVYVFFVLLDNATHVISTLLGSETGLIGALEMVALWGADLVPLPTEFISNPRN